ncbi:hypothetical protein WPS_13490 [Vulcanimicrobium alpinum]|uniref:Uncharacterized protein n=1 Tax=Vulcanimicrobium alpinum TaxID=3016050 RepID=A0AAN2C9K1_UNVUL|nr:hypothetical protein [Vulcanimicrobium alpinum]BDE06073.1 hypothetical protein WPS_13490 [Vulcanimicrobium alpinum]
MFAVALRVALVAGIIIDGAVGLLCIFAQPLIAPLLGVPVKDPAVTAFLGGELIVAACIYALILRDTPRWQPLLWLCALDQTLGVAIPAVQIALGNAPASLQTIAPMPFQAILVALYVAGARRAVRPA